MVGAFFLLRNDAGYYPGAQAPISSKAGIAPASPHTAGENAKSLSRVQLHVLYFVPRDRAQSAWNGWEGTAQGALEAVSAFHRLQFRGLSELTFELVPGAIIGEQDSGTYDSADTARGNPHAWRMIREELDRRAPLPQEEGIFHVRVVLYEGVGALGGERQILASSAYLRNTHTGYDPASVLYHELGHAFGLEDAYDHEYGSPSDEDIMGLGRQKPIGQAYLSDIAKKKLGIQ